MSAIGPQNLPFDGIRAFRLPPRGSRTFEAENATLCNLSSDWLVLGLEKREGSEWDLRLQDCKSFNISAFLPDLASEHHWIHLMAPTNATASKIKKTTTAIFENFQMGLSLEKPSQIDQIAKTDSFEGIVDFDLAPGQSRTFAAEKFTVTNQTAETQRVGFGTIYERWQLGKWERAECFYGMDIDDFVINPQSHRYLDLILPPPPKIPNKFESLVDKMAEHYNNQFRNGAPLPPRTFKIVLRPEVSSDKAT